MTKAQWEKLRASYPSIDLTPWKLLQPYEKRAVSKAKSRDVTADLLQSKLSGEPSQFTFWYDELPF